MIGLSNDNSTTLAYLNTSRLKSTVEASRTQIPTPPTPPFNLPANNSLNNNLFGSLSLSDVAQQMFAAYRATGSESSAASIRGAQSDPAMRQLNAYLGLGRDYATSSASVQSRSGNASGDISLAIGPRASGSVSINGSQLNAEGSFETGIGVEANGRFNYGRGEIDATASARVGAEGSASLTVGPNGFTVEASAEIGASIEATVRNETEVVDGVTSITEVSGYAYAGAGVEGRASQNISANGASASAFGGAHAGAEVGAGTSQTVGVGNSSATGGAGVSVGPSIGAQGGAEFELSSNRIMLGGEMDLDLGIGLSVEANIDISTRDVSRAANAVSDAVSSGSSAVSSAASSVASETTKAATSTISSTASAAVSAYRAISSVKFW
ncbi:hypothetical protein D5085_04800 [Ectothiorhodospiraceae bacterium BW-2]|nr:hypothetical protein D5085_04800 [Ectothiorhodospiraceae bacterium BW-2]